MYQILFKSNKISSKFHIFYEKYWMSCISGGNSCGFPGRFSSESWSRWSGEGGKGQLQVLDWKLCLEVVFVFQVSVHCSYIVEIHPEFPWINLLVTVVARYWYITNPVTDFLFRFYAHSTFHLHAWRLGGNTWGSKLFRISWSPHQNLAALITGYKCSKRELLSEGGIWPPSISADATIK